MIIFFLCSYLVSGNLENNSTMKTLKEINYFDGDANAVTSDLSNNVDVRKRKRGKCKERKIIFFYFISPP